MKFLRFEKDRYVFLLGADEKSLFEFLLRLYPVIPSAHQGLSKSSPASGENQKLLDEALAEQRAENKQYVEKLLTEDGRFKETDADIELSLTAGEIEMVLQVLNDVRVGNWILLGSPDQHPRFNPNAENAAYVLTMEFASMFQMYFLEAIKK